MLSVPEFAERLGTSIANVRGAVRERRVVGVGGRGGTGVAIPEAFLVPAHLANGADPRPEPRDGSRKEVILPSLRGTIIVLGDEGLDDTEILQWLFTANDALEGDIPLDVLKAGNKSAVRRAAAFLG